MSDELPFSGDEAEPTAEEYDAVSLLWRKGELLPFPWVVVDLSGVISPKTGQSIPAGTKVMLKSPAVWTERFADEVNLDPGLKFDSRVDS
jgi:hypothetical protein